MENISAIMWIFLSVLNLSNTVEGKLSGCLVLGRQETYLLFHSLQKTVWILRLVSGLMVSGIDLKFTFYSKIFLSF